jgi:hypothetical protein
MDTDALVVVVEDWGEGLEGHGDTPDAAKLSGLGQGLKLIQALASTVEITSGVGRGTRIRMQFDRTSLV